MERQKDHTELLQEIHDFEQQLADANDTLAAIHNGLVDALLVTGPDGDQVYTLQSAERPYRVLVEAMQEGAVTLSTEGLILYCNQRFADMLQYSLEHVIGESIYSFVILADQHTLHRLMESSRSQHCRGEITFLVSDETWLPASVALSALQLDDEMTAACMVASDLSEQKRREAELLSLQQQLRESQKALESRVKERTAELSASNQALGQEILERTRMAERLARLQTVTTGLSAALTAAEVAQVVVNQGQQAVGAGASALALLNEQGRLFGFTEDSRADGSSPRE